MQTITTSLAASSDQNIQVTPHSCSPATWWVHRWPGVLLCHLATACVTDFFGVSMCHWFRETSRGARLFAQTSTLDFVSTPKCKYILVLIQPRDRSHERYVPSRIQVLSRFHFIASYPKCVNLTHLSPCFSLFVFFLDLIMSVIWAFNLVWDPFCSVPSEIVGLIEHSEASIPSLYNTYSHTPCFSKSYFADYDNEVQHGLPSRIYLPPSFFLPLTHCPLNSSPSPNPHNGLEGGWLEARLSELTQVLSYKGKAQSSHV